MESIRNQRHQFRTDASKAEGELQRIEFEMMRALEKIAAALGLERDAQPEQIAEAVALKQEHYAQGATNVVKCREVLAEAGITGTGIVDGMRALAGRAETALKDQKILADRVKELEEERDQYRTWFREAKRQRDGYAGEVNGARRSADAWEQSARDFSINADYYRGLLIKIGELFGIAAKTSDDGSVQQDVLVAKVPELVQAAVAERDALDRLVAMLREAEKKPESVPPAPKRKWEFAPTVGVIAIKGVRCDCWKRAVVEHQWFPCGFNPNDCN